MFSNCLELVRFIENSKRVTPKKDLSNMLYYLNSLGNPHKNLPVIHITGTNGKGSVVSYLENVLKLYKLNVGSFTSPYIKDFNERIRYNGLSISDEDLLKYGNIIYSNFSKWQEELGETPAFFEFVTLICFLYFKNITDLDVLILEVGIGGRLDSTNVVDSLISAVTSISFDHMNLLGNTLEDILTEQKGNQHEQISFNKENIEKVLPYELTKRDKRYIERYIIKAIQTYRSIEREGGDLDDIDL